MRKFVNNLSATGVLVKKDIKEFTTKTGVDAIGGSLVLRTADGSEHEFRIYANKFKKDENKNITDEVSKLFTAYETVMNEYVDMEEDKDNPTVVRISDGEIDVNDYKSQTGEVKTFNQVSSKFQNRVEAKDLDTTPQVAKFEIEGIIESMSDEIKKNEPTGNMIILLNAIKQRADGFGKEAKYEADSLIPIKLTVEKDLVEAFSGAGYYEGCFAKFVGEPINMTTEETIEEKQAFGKPNIKIVKTTIRQYKVVSGNSATTIYDNDLTDEIFQQLVAKRKHTLEEVASGFAKTEESDTPFAQADAKPSSNPFAKANGEKKNPFAK